MYVSGTTLENAFFTPSMQVCGGTSVDLVVVPQNGVPPYTFVWNTSSSTNDTLRVTPNVTTIYNVTVTDGCGTTFTAADTITVEPNTNPGGFKGETRSLIFELIEANTLCSWFRPFCGEKVNPPPQIQVRSMPTVRRAGE